MPAVQETEFLISNLSLPPLIQTIGSVAATEGYVEHIGADGLEITPTRIGNFMGHLLRRANMVEDPSAYSFAPFDYAFSQPEQSAHKDHSDTDTAFTRLVRSLHSSFRNDTDDNGLVARMVPDWRTSLRQMARIQTITGGKLAAVLYPGFKNEDGTDVVYSDENAPFADRTFQPKASEWQHMGLTEDSPISAIEEAMLRQGLTGITWDVGPHSKGFKDPAMLAARLAAAGLIRRVHLSVSRLDLTGLYSPEAKATRHAKQAFTHSAAAARNTPEGEILTAIAAADRERATSLHVQLALKSVVLEDGPLRVGPSKRDHTAIIAHAQELVAS